jgi:hypothetical protein
MSIKLKALTGLGFVLFFFAGITESVKACSAHKTHFSTSESLSSLNTDIKNQNFLISQLRGHETYDGGSQMEWGDYLLGRVVAKVGNILFIKLDNGDYFHATGDAYSGADVLVEEVNGRYQYVSMAHSSWISVLRSKYGWKQVTASASLNERTAAIWQEIEASSSRTATIAPPPRTTTPVTTTPAYNPVEYQPTSTPVRGLY